MKNTFRTLRFCLMAVVTIPVAFGAMQVYGQGKAHAVIPGSGHAVEGVGDDFEDENWTFDYQLPKVYNLGDTPTAKNLPLGFSANKRWHEGQKRGQPDIVARIETPPEGLAGSQGALLLRSKTTGTTHPSYQQQQDDFIANVGDLVGKIPVSQTPSVVTRVWFPPVEEWEQRSGCHFAFRISLETNAVNQTRFRRAAYDPEAGLYWPGFFLNRELPKTTSDGKQTPDRYYFWLKATADSRAIQGPELKTMGWWTLGMSVTPNGEVHYYAKPGLEDLTAEDHVASSFPFGHQAVLFRSFFFNVCNGDNGNTWSTPFVVDDPTVFVVK